MSRSFKHQPFMAICGNRGAKDDKRLANRGVRRTHKQSIRKTDDFESFLLPHRLECTYNDVWGWCRDGHQFYHGLDHRDWQRYLEAEDDYFGVWPPRWYSDMMRK